MSSHSQNHVTYPCGHHFPSSRVHARSKILSCIVSFVASFTSHPLATSLITIHPLHLPYRNSSPHPLHLPYYCSPIHPFVTSSPSTLRFSVSRSACTACTPHTMHSLHTSQPSLCPRPPFVHSPPSVACNSCTAAMSSSCPASDSLEAAVNDTTAAASSFLCSWD